ncbi:MAG: molybdopterin dinucleotide binding domain-containing protein, partial [bacterium]|nr:molybdopterin dinucleotide binding domain-containing protein [bacterium]
NATRFIPIKHRNTAGLFLSTWYTIISTCQFGSRKIIQNQLFPVKSNGKFIKGWNTPSRLVEFTSELAGSKKDRNGNPVDAQPAYAQRNWTPTTDFPLFLTAYKEANHTHTRTQNNPWLMELTASASYFASINTATAAKLGINDQDEIWIESPHAKAKGVARLTQGIHPEVIAVQRGFGHWGLGARAVGKGTSDGQFNVTVSDPLSGMAMHKEICVKVYKA